MGNINDTVDLPVGGSVTYSADCTVSDAATDTLTNSASVSVPTGMVESNSGDNSDDDVDSVVVPEQRTLSDQTVTGTVTYEAHDSITVGPDFTVSSTGDVTLRVCNAVTFVEPFTVMSGGTMTVVIDPTLCSP